MAGILYCLVTHKQKSVYVVFLRAHQVSTIDVLDCLA